MHRSPHTPCLFKNPRQGRGCGDTQGISNYQVDFVSKRWQVRLELLGEGVICQGALHGRGGASALSYLGSEHYLRP